MSDELNVWAAAITANTETDDDPYGASADAAAAVIRDYGDKRDADAYQRGKLEGARLALEAAAKVAAWAHMVPPDGGSPSEAEKDVADNAAAAIRALDPAKIVGEG